MSEVYLAHDLVAVIRGDDPALELVIADLDAWLSAHPCDCEALCTCDDEAA